MASDTAVRDSTDLASFVLILVQSACNARQKTFLEKEMAAQ